MSAPKTSEAKAYAVALEELDEALRALTQACRVVADKRFAYSLARDDYMRTLVRDAVKGAAGGAS